MSLRATYEVARKEFLQLLRTKRLLGVGLALIVTMVLLTIVVPIAFFDLDQEGAVEDEFGDELGEGAAIQNFVLLFFLSGFLIISGYFFIQLLPILLTADAVCSEWSNRTIFLLLSKPVPRWAFVLGKFFGIAVPVALFVAALLVLDYLALLTFVPDTPDAEAWGRFAGAVGIIALGVLAFSAVALFFSTLTRSGVASMLLTVVSWILVFPILAQTAFFIALARDKTGGLGDGPTWSEYLSPGDMMGTASRILLPGDLGFAFAVFGGGFPEAEWWQAVLALVAHTVFFVVLSLVVVQSRNFE